MGFENSISITYGFLDYIFQILDTENVSVKQIMPCLAVLSQKSENGIANIIKIHIILWQKLKVIWKAPNDLEKLRPDFSKEGKEERQLGMKGFSTEILVLQHTL